MRFLFLLFTLIFIVSCGVQKPSNSSFEGMFVYKLSSEMINPNDEDSLNYQVVYVKDSMLRIENFTQIGKQVYIKHIPKNRAYILMDIYAKKIAIQSYPDDAPNAGKYKFKSKMGKKNIAGRKAKNIQVEIPDVDSVFQMNYYPDISPKYSEALPGIPGLPAKFTLFSKNEFIDYEIVQIEEREVSIDIFGIPNDYEVMTMDEFVKLIGEEE